MEYDDFQDAVLELAAGGTRITKGNVALRLKVDPASAGTMLDRMTRDGRLELDVDERSGEIFYEVRDSRRGGEGSAGSKGALVELGKALDGGALAAKVGTAIAMGKVASAGGALAPDQRRKIGVGILLGGLLPGFGLAYTAPWPVVVGLSAVVIVGVKVIGIIPILSSFLLVPFLVVCAVASAILGGLYTWQYNQTGRRSPLGNEPVTPKQILKRLKK